MQPDNVAAIFLDQGDRKGFVVTKDILVNSLRRDAVKIEESFDKLHEDELKELSEVLAQTWSVMVAGYRRACRESDDLRITCTHFLFNANNSLIGGVTLLRRGLYLQCSTLIRSVWEQCATAIHLMVNPNDIGLFKSKKGIPLKSIQRTVNRVNPEFGRMYGFLSENFVHMGPLQGTHHPIRTHTPHSDEVLANLGFLRGALWFIAVSCDLLFIDLNRGRRFWEREGSNGARFQPDAETLEWQKNFLRE